LQRLPRGRRHGDRARRLRRRRARNPAVRADRLRGRARRRLARRRHVLERHNASVIRRADLNGSEAQIVVDDFGWEPLGVALDVAFGKMYWNDRQGVKRANLDGSDEELLVTGAAGGFIALDLPAERMYWVQAGTIKSAAMAPGAGVTTVVSGQAAVFGIAID